MVAPRPGGSLFWLAAFIAAAHGVCDPPPPPLNNTVSNEDPAKVSYETDSTVTYVCDEQKGYVQSPGKSGTITCLSDATWSEIQEFCERSCKLPPRLQFGEVLDSFINRNVFPVGTNVTYKCRPGYVIKRGMRKTVTCFDTLQWTEIQEFCDRKDCGNPGEPVNGNVTFQEGDDGKMDTKFGSTVTFFCDKGFRMLGRNKRRCTVDGWNNAVPNCETVICPKPPDIDGGMHTSTGQEEFKYQTGVTYSCNLNTFSLIGEASIHCTEDGSWSGSPPKCKVISCGSPDVPNAKRTSGFGVSHTFKDSVGFACKTGFVMNGSRLIECGEDNKWHPPVPVCQLVTCGSPPEIADGTHDGTGPFAYGTSLTYRCSSEEFKLTGEPSILCGIDGFWSEQIPTCRVVTVVTCGSPPQIADGTHDGTEPFANGTSVTYRCNSEGFMLYGESSILCEINGSWTGQIPRCRAVAVLGLPFKCKMPEIAHGKVIPLRESSNENKKNIEIRCDTLYVIHGESWIPCIEEKNQWHTSLPECHLSQGFVAAIIILVLIIILVVVVCLYWYNKKKQGHYPTNEKDGKAEAMQLKDSNHAVDA